MSNKILLCGNDCFKTPSVNMIQTLSQLGQLGYEFLVGNNTRIDQRLQEALFTAGVKDKAKIYTLDSKMDNRFEIEERKYKLKDDFENQKCSIISPEGQCEALIERVINFDEVKARGEYFTFVLNKMADDADMLLLIYDGEMTKTLFRLVNLFNSRNKQVLSIKVG